MASIYKTKEVFKNLSPVIKEKPLRRARGVYVTGAYRPPYYISHTLTIRSISSNIANVIRYYETHVDAGSGTYCLSTKSVHSNHAIDITRYSQTSKQVTGTYCLSTKSVHAAALVLDKYYRTHKETLGTYCLSTKSVHSNHTIEIEPHSSAKVYADLTPNGCLLSIFDVTSIPATVEDV